MCWDVLVSKDGFNHAHWQATILIAVVRASLCLPASLNIPTRWSGLSFMISCLVCSHFPTTRANCITIHKLRVNQDYSQDQESCGSLILLSLWQILDRNSSREEGLLCLMVSESSANTLLLDSYYLAEHHGLGTCRSKGYLLHGGWEDKKEEHESKMGRD